MSRALSSATQVLARAAWARTYGNSPRNLDRLFKNEISCIVVPQFLSGNLCDKIVKELDQFSTTYYPNVNPPVGKIGVSQYELGPYQKDEYFSTVKDSNRPHEHLMSVLGIDPRALVIDYLKESLGGECTDVGIAKEEDGREYFAGLFRRVNSTAQLHFDYCRHDADGSWSINQTEEQLSWNVCLTDIEDGGECIVYDQPWKEQYTKKKHSYSYDLAYVDGVQVKVITPKKGDLYFFNSRNFHEVRECKGDRVTFSSFIGRVKETGDNMYRLFLWS